MNGNAFRININRKNFVGEAINGRFDLWAMKNPGFEPPVIEKDPKKAMIELGATFTSRNSYDSYWNDPKLDSEWGYYTSKSARTEYTWW